jgi:putative nucleotidyltransferase with HDIG domain
MVLLGNNQMMRILVTCGALQFLRGAHLGYGLDKGELWEHSMACALLSQILSKSLGQPEDHSLFTGALLHDVGKIILNEYAGVEYQAILRQVMGQNRSALEAEREVLGIDHAQIGKLLADRWQFPQHISGIVERHHDPVDLDRDPLALCLVHTANLLCLMMGIGVGDSGLSSRAAPKLIEAFGWSTDDLDGFMKSLSVELEKVQELLGLGRSEEAG